MLQNNHTGTIQKDFLRIGRVFQNYTNVLPRFRIPKSKDRFCNISKSYSIGHVTGSVFIRIHQYRFLFQSKTSFHILIRDLYDI